MATTALAVTILGGYLWSQRAHIVRQFSLDPAALGAIAALTAVMLFLRGLSNRALFGRLGVDASARDWFAVSAVQSFSNYLPLSAGLFAKAYYLKRVHGLPLADFGVAQVSLLFLFTATNGSVGLIATLLGPTGSATPWLAAAFAGMAAAGAVALLPVSLTGPLLRRVERWFPWNERTARAIREAAPAVLPLQIGVLLVSTLCLQLGFSMVRADVGFAACAIFSAATVITRVVSLTPGALGFREFLIGGLAVVTGFELEDAVIAATAARVGEMLAVFVLGGAYTYRLSDRVASTYD
jgi:uncharacterized membrane protein YbhN (UPF0104 family)